MFFGIKSRTNFEHRPDVIAVHVIDGEYGGGTLQMDGYGRGRVAEIVSIVGGAYPRIPVSGDLQPTRVVNVILHFVLLTEAAAVVKITFKDIRGLGFKKIERHLFVN